MLLVSISELVDKVTGVEGSFGYVVIIFLVVVGYTWTGAYITSPDRVSAAKTNTMEEEADPPRNFTMQQLRYFDGNPVNPAAAAAASSSAVAAAAAASSSSEEDMKPAQPPVVVETTTTTTTKPVEMKPVYLSLNGTVFDVSGGRDFYGPGGPYESFAGRECGIALAKMSFDASHLDDLDGCATKLNFGERNQLDEWYERFRYHRNYPVKGRLVVDLPSPDRIVTMVELLAAQQQQQQQAPKIPAGYAAAPIYVGVGTKVFDVSFGGVTAYGPGGPYHKFAGKDVSRALATMSLDDATVNSTHIDDLTEKQLATMNDWIKTFEEKKMYPIVGRLQKK